MSLEEAFRLICYGADMKRTTILLPDDLARVVDDERRRRDVSTAELVRLALRSYLGLDADRPRRLPFAALGRSGHSDTSERVDELLERDWGRPADG